MSDICLWILPVLQSSQVPLLEQITSANKCLCVFLHQMETTVYVNFFVRQFLLRCGR